jgi:hypothetical protein
MGNALDTCCETEENVELDTSLRIGGRRKGISPTIGTQITSSGGSPKAFLSVSERLATQEDKYASNRS